RARPELRVFVRDVRVVQEAIAAVLMAQIQPKIAVVTRRREARRVLSADRHDLALVAVFRRELEQMVVAERQIALAEEQIFVERRARRTQKAIELAATRGILSERDRLRRFERLRLVGHEEVHAVPNDRTAERHTVLLLFGFDFAPSFSLERIRGAPAVGCAVPEGRGLELVRSRTRDRYDRRAAQLIEFGLVVRRDDLVLADAELREGIAARRGLAGNAAAQDVVLLADAID